MKVVRDPEMMARFETAFELAELSVEMMRQNLRRRNPDLDEEGIEELLLKWLHRPDFDPDHPLFRPSRRYAHLYYDQPEIRGSGDSDEPDP